ncbi:MAG: PKD domain-containing protein [Planctomycetota bacterium]|jgi:hypothetical protein
MGGSNTGKGTTRAATALLVLLLCGTAAANEAPTADAGVDQKVQLGTLVTLDGMGSEDPDGDPLSFSWVQISGEAVDLYNVTTASPTFTPGMTGLYEFQLTVSDGTHTDTDQVIVEVVPPNRGPILSPIGDLKVFEGGFIDVTLTAYDEDGDDLTFGAKGLPANAVLNPETGYFFFAPAYGQAGKYEVTFSVFDGKGGYDSETVTISVVGFSENKNPVADAGADQTVEMGTRVMLDGRNSFDPNGQPLSFSWKQVAGTAVGLTGTTTASPQFTAAEKGSFTFELTVSDGTKSDADRVTVMVVEPNYDPVLDPVGDKTVPEGEKLSFTLTATDANGHLLTYSSSALPPNAVLDPATGHFEFTPDYTQADVYSVTFFVSDGHGASDSETIAITVIDTNQAPIADAGSDQLIVVGTRVTLDGRRSLDPDGQPITFAWSQTAGPAVVLTGATTNSPYFKPEVEADYTFELVVSDGSLSSSDEVTISALPPTILPELDPIGDKLTQEGATLLFTLTASDGNGDPLTFYAAGLPAYSSLNPNTGVFRFTPDFEQAGDYELTFVVTDGRGGSDSESVTIAVTETNRPPVADAGPDQRMSAGTPKSLDGTGSYDPDGDAIGYFWTQVAGPAVTLSNPASAAPSFTPAVAGTLVFELVVDDGFLLSAADPVTVVVVENTQRLAFTGESTDLKMISSATAGWRFTLEWAIRITEIRVDGWLIGTSNNVGIWREGDPNAIALYSVTTDPSMQVVPISVNRVLQAGTYRIAGVFQKYRYTPIADLEFGEGIINPAGVYQVGSTLAYPGATNAAYLYGHVNFRYDAAGGNQAPQVNAGPDREVVWPNAAVLSGTATDDGMPSGTLATTWTVQSGPGTAVFADASAAATTATFSSLGTYVLRLTADDGELQSIDDMRVTVSADARPNEPPVAYAGDDQTIGLEDIALLNGTVTDDGLPFPPGQVTALWRQVSGPAVAAFGDCTAPQTAAWFTEPGEYVLELTAHDSELTDASRVTITVVDAGMVLSAGGGGGGGGGGCGSVGLDLLLAACLPWLLRRRRRRSGSPKSTTLS